MKFFSTIGFSIGFSMGREGRSGGLGAEATISAKMNGVKRYLIENFSKTGGLEYKNTRLYPILDNNNLVPAKKKIYLSKVSNYHNRASIDNIPLVNVHPENIEMFKKVNQVLDVKLSGIDFITTNISVPYYLEGVIIEVNERPDLQIHYDTTENKKDL